MTSSSEDRGSTLRLAAIQLSAFRQSRTALTLSWFPDEPLAGTNPFSGEPLHWSLDALAKLSRHREFSVLRQECKELYEKNLAKKLGQILTFCNELAVDVVVLPEYSIPSTLLEVLANFANRLVIVAGTGFVRESDILQYKQLGIADQLKHGHNAAVVIGPKLAYVVTKAEAMDGEAIEKGRGARIVRLPTGIDLGVAICKDFLLESGPLAKESPDVVAIPALTPSTVAFASDAPRDYLRILANHASAGGSFIHIPDLEFPRFVDRNGTIPLPPRQEGIVIVDFERYRPRPTPTTRTTNRLVARSAIVYEGVSDENTGAVAALTRASNVSQITLDLLR